MSVINTEEDNISEERANQILSRINSLNSALYKKEEEKNKIIAARDKVNRLASRPMEDAQVSFEWTANKMDEYWQTTNSSVRDMVQESLRNVANEFGKNGAVNSELPGLLAKTEEKLTELDNEINNLQNELNSLENELRTSDV